MMTRRSAQINAKAEAKPPRQSEQVESHATKKKKKSHANDETVVSKKKRGDSKLMKDVPLDVLLEICTFVEPLDLLHLSKVSKGMRELLTSTNSAHIWKLTYQNVRRLAPPLCPDDANIVLYTEFLYGHNCQLCGSGHGSLNHESVFVRLCSKCAPESFVFRHAAKLKQGVADLCHQWLLPKLGAHRTIFRPEYNKCLKEYEQAVEDEELGEYLKQRCNSLQERKKIASKIATWRRQFLRDQRDTKKFLRCDRLNEIKKKLKDEGFDFGIYQNELRRAPHVHKPNPLSDTEWDSVRVDIVDFFQSLRDEKNFDDAISELHQYISDINTILFKKEIRPTAWWIANSEPIASLLKKMISKPAVKEKAKLEIGPDIENLNNRWQDETDGYLASLVPQSGKGRKGKKVSNQVLKLATTFFKCHWCTEPISYPRVLVHHCFDDEKFGGDDDEPDGSEDEVKAEVVKVRRQRGPREPRPPAEIDADAVFSAVSAIGYSMGMCAGKKGVTFDEEASEAVKAIIVACGENSNTVTNEAMDRNSHRLECLRCKSGTRRRLGMSWTMALVHDLEEHYGENPSSEPTWLKITSDSELKKIATGETKLSRKFKSPLSCNHCSLHVMAQSKQLQGHLGWTHQIDANQSTYLSHFTAALDEQIKVKCPPVKI